MKNKLNIVLISLSVSILILVFYRWFLQGEIIGGDWPFLFDETLKEFSLPVSSWNTWQGNGLGGTNPIYFLQSFEYLTVFLATSLHIPWTIIYKVFWFGLFIALSVSSSMYLLSVVLSKTTLWQKLIAATIFTTNTYILMVVDGGQMGVALAYSVAPLVLGVFVKLINLINSSYSNFKFQISNFKFPVIAGLALSLQILFDPRLAYITMLGATLYFMFNITRNMIKNLYRILFVFVIPVVIAVLLHIFWLLPLLIFSQKTYEGLGGAYINVGIVKFLSFSTFSQSLSLLHANWPENIFGKSYFMKPEFLIIPIIVFSSLFFVRKISDSKKKIIYFCVLGLLGVFLGKGANPPFGDVYLWLFENIPGFIMFRDSTKFYLLVALSYSILIPFSIYSICGWLNSKLKSQKSKQQLKIQNFLPNLFLLFTIAYLLFLIYPAIFGQLGGTFKKHDVPKEYIELKDFLYKQPEFFRTLWIPRQQRFTFYSNVHPSVEAGPLFNATSPAEAVRKLEREGAAYLSRLSIKYVIVSYDSLGEIFQKDRKYDDETYRNTAKALEKITWLKKISGFGKIEVFETSSVKDHLWLMENGIISYEMINPANYLINVSLAYPQKLVFSEKYDPSWIIKVGNKTIKSQKTLDNLNSFELKKGSYDLEMIFLQDKVYDYGRIISLVTFLGALFFIFKYRKCNALSN